MKSRMCEKRKTLVSVSQACNPSQFKGLTQRSAFFADALIQVESRFSLSYESSRTERLEVTSNHESNNYGLTRSLRHIRRKKEGGGDDVCFLILLLNP